MNIQNYSYTLSIGIKISGIKLYFRNVNINVEYEGDSKIYSDKLNSLFELINYIILVDKEDNQFKLFEDLHNTESAQCLEYSAEDLPSEYLKNFIENQILYNLQLKVNSIEVNEII